MTDAEIRLKIATDALDEAYKWLQCHRPHSTGAVIEGISYALQRIKGPPQEEIDEHVEETITNMDTPRRDEVDWDAIKKEAQAKHPASNALSAILALKQWGKSLGQRMNEAFRRISVLKEEIEGHRKWHRDEVGPDRAQSRVNTRDIAALKKRHGESLANHLEMLGNHNKVIAALKQDRRQESDIADLKKRVEANRIITELHNVHGEQITDLCKRVDELESMARENKHQIDGIQGKIPTLSESEKCTCNHLNPPSDKANQSILDCPIHGKKEKLPTETLTDGEADKLADEPREGDLVWWKSGHAGEYMQGDQIDRLVKPTEIDVVRDLIVALKEVIRTCGPETAAHNVATRVLYSLPDRVQITREE